MIYKTKFTVFGKIHEKYDYLYFLDSKKSKYYFLFRKIIFSNFRRSKTLDKEI
jgi:hypothetical protein